MTNTIPALFKRSLIAAAVLSLSACSSTPRNDDYDLSRVGEGILTAGRTTADVTERVWNKTTYLLGFTEGDSEPRSDEGLLMDAEEMAQLEDNPTIARDTTIRPIVLRTAIPTRAQQEGKQQKTPINAELVENGLTPDLETPTNRELDDLAQSASNTSVTSTKTDSALLGKDRVHKVTSSETLWDIAKMTTGDATNWHVLADVNNLGPNASVYPGDLLIIPADMVKPSSTDDAPSESSANQPPEQIFVDTQNLTGASGSQAASQAAQPELETTTTAQAERRDTLETTQPAGKAVKLDPGETLWNLAKRITGDATNWKAIARQNDFSAAQASLVRTGQTIYVPEDLIKPELESAKKTATPALDTTVNQRTTERDTRLEAIQSAAGTTRTRTEEPAPVQTDGLRTLTISSDSTSTSAARNTDFLNLVTNLGAESSAIVEARQPIKIVEATFKSDEIAAPLGQTTDAIKSTDTDALSPEQIMVSGTYYPKAIYNNADFSSSLLMRVSPGTTLQVSKAMGNWYQVETSKGLGYVHQRDIK